MMPVAEGKKRARRDQKVGVRPVSGFSCRCGSRSRKKKGMIVQRGGEGRTPVFYTDTVVRSRPGLQ